MARTQPWFEPDHHAVLNEMRQYQKARLRVPDALRSRWKAIQSAEATHHAAMKKPKRNAVWINVRKVFYASEKWRKVRYQVLDKYKAMCMCCGNGPPDVALHVDHIKPVSKHPELALDINNLQILCVDCNLGKSNTSSTDWRSRAADRDVLADLFAEIPPKP